MEWATQERLDAQPTSSKRSIGRQPYFDDLEGDRGNPAKKCIGQISADAEGGPR
jgi:hypothetical protein